MKIDCHVHVVGNGTGGTGCWYRPRGVTRYGAPLMLREVGLSRSALRGDLDKLYVEQMLRFIRESSLDAAVILAQDEPHRENGERIPDAGSFYVPNEFVLGLARRHPEFLAAISIHPARPDALEELERCIAGGAVMLKCLPNCQNIDWNNPRYTRFLERMAESGLLLLAHTGSERTLPVIDARLASPRVLTRALEIGVTCIAAHSGTGTMLIDPDYFDTFVEMTRTYPRLYGDNSALAACNFRARRRAVRQMTTDPELAARILHGSDVPVPVTGALMWTYPRLYGDNSALAACNFRARRRAVRQMTTDPELAARILHGSDVPVPVTGALMWTFGILPFGEWRRTAAIANPIERDAELKRAAGFGEATFTRLSGLLRKR